MAQVITTGLVFNLRRPSVCTSKRYLRGPFGSPKRSFEERNRLILTRHEKEKLKLAEPIEGKPGQWRRPEPPKEPKILKNERKLPPLVKAGSPYHKYSKEDIQSIENLGIYYDPLFNPHLIEERHRVNPDEEPFNAIYIDSKSESVNDYTKVRNITSPQLWEFVERLARIKVAPVPPKRKATDPPIPLPSGFVPPPESPPDLPYFIPRTRNFLLPVYYHLDQEPDKCYTLVKQVTGDLWQLEEDIRTHLESLHKSKRRILTSVEEPDGRVMFRGRHLHEVVDWLHSKGF